MYDYRLAGHSIVIDEDGNTHACIIIVERDGTRYIMYGSITDYIDN